MHSYMLALDCMQSTMSRKAKEILFATFSSFHFALLYSTMPHPSLHPQLKADWLHVTLILFGKDFEHPKFIMQNLVSL